MLVAAIAGFADRGAHRQRLARVRAPAPAPARCWRRSFGVLVIWLNTNQYATGLALSLFGAGFSAFVGIRYTQEKLAERPHFDDPRAGRHAVRRAGAVPPASDGLPRDRADRRRWPGSCTARAPAWCCARSASRPSRRMRSAIRCGASASPRWSSAARCAALAGAYVSVVYTPLWVEGMIAGKGWIALALTTFATWRPARVLLGAYLFGGVTMLQFHLQGEGVQIAEPVPDDAAVPGDDRRAGADLAQRRRGSASTCRRRSASRSSPAHESRCSHNPPFSHHNWRHP